MNSDDRIRPPDVPLTPGETYIDYGPQLPGAYGILTIHALVRDPRCVFTYWEWPAPPAGRTWAVRLRDAESGRTAVHRLDEGAAGAGTLHFDAAPERSYEVDLGWSEGDDFTAVRSSNRVKTPRDREATAVDPDWTPQPGERAILGSLAGEVFIQGSLHLRSWGPSHV